MQLNTYKHGINSLLIYKHDIPLMRCIKGITSAREDGRGDVIPGEHPAGMSYLHYYTEKKCKTEKGKKYKQRFWINTRRLPCGTSFTGRSLGKICGCSWVSFGLAVANQLTHSCCYVLIDQHMYMPQKLPNNLRKHWQRSC